MLPRKLRVICYWKMYKYRFLIRGYYKHFSFEIWWFIRCWLLWKPRRVIWELWKYGYVRSGDQRVGQYAPRRNLAKWRNDFAQWRYDRSIGYNRHKHIDESVDKTGGRVDTLSRILKQMANTTIVGATTERPANSGIVSAGGVKLYVHDIINDRAEYHRISKSLIVLGDRIMGQIDKLANRNFSTKAKPEVIVREWDLLNVLLSEQQCLCDSLDELNYMGDS